MGCRPRLQKNLSGTRRYQAVPGGTKRYDRAPFSTPNFVFRVLTVPLRGNTRQYPVPHAGRTPVHFLAAYCRLTVRLLPRNQFSCRVKPRNALAFGVHASGPKPRASCLPIQLSKNPLRHRCTMPAFTAHGLPLTAHFPGASSCPWRLCTSTNAIHSRTKFSPVKFFCAFCVLCVPCG